MAWKYVFYKLCMVLLPVCSFLSILNNFDQGGVPITKIEHFSKQGETHASHQNTHQYVLLQKDAPFHKKVSNKFNPFSLAGHALWTPSPLRTIRLLIDGLQ